MNRRLGGEIVNDSTLELGLIHDDLSDEKLVTRSLANRDEVNLSHLRGGSSSGAPAADGGSAADGSTSSDSGNDGSKPNPADCGECFRAVTCRRGGCDGPVTQVGCCACPPGDIDDLGCAKDAAAD